MTSNTLTKLGFTPNTVTDPSDLYPTLWYPLHEGTGLTVSDAFGNGYQLDFSGTTTNLWTNTGYGAGNATDVKAVKGASATAGQTTYVDAIFNLQTLKDNLGSCLYIGYEYACASDMTVAGTVAHWGRNNSTFGGVWFEINSAEQPSFNVKGDASSVTNPLTVGRTFSYGYSGVKACVGVFYFSDANTLVGTYFIEGLNAGTNSLDLTGVTMPVGSTEGLALMARRTSGTSFTNFSGSGSGYLGNIWFQRRPTFDPNLCPLALADMISNRMNFPLSMRT